MSPPYWLLAAEDLNSCKSNKTTNENISTKAKMRYDERVFLALSLSEIRMFYQ
jgi:hypothetical protein